MTAPNMPRDIRVLIANPVGGKKGIKGGIARLMDELRQELEINPLPYIAARFEVTRGKHHILISPLCFCSFICRFLCLRASNKVDLLHINLASHGSTWRKAIIAHMARILGIPYIIHLHGGGYRDFWQCASTPQKRIIRALFLGATRIIVLGRVWRDFIVDIMPETSERVIILHNATRRPPSRIRKSDKNEATIIFLGRIERQKGFFVLIHALKLLEHIGPWKAIIAGNGSLREAQESITALGLEERVRLVGWLSREEVSKLLAKAEILVLPSFDEGLPIAIIEAMGAGLAIVATPVGAIPEIIENGKTGILVPPGDANALATAIRRLLENPSFRSRIGRAADQYHAKHLDIRKYADALVNIWREAIR